MKKRVLTFGFLSLLYLGGGLLLQQCYWWSCSRDQREVKDFMVNDADWLIGYRFNPVDLQEGQFVRADSLYIQFRLLDYHFVETASLFQILPSALACSPASPRSVQKVSGLTVTLLDSVELADGSWLLPNQVANEHLNVALEHYNVGNITQFLTRPEPRLESAHAPLSLQWMSEIAKPTPIRLQIKMELSDGKRFETPDMQPVVLRIY